MTKYKGTEDWSEVLEPIHHVVRELIEKESKTEGQSEPFTDSDVIAVTLLYSMVMGNRFYYELDSEKVGLGFAQKMSNHFSKTIQDTTMAMSGLDVKKYYKK